MTKFAISLAMVSVALAQTTTITGTLKGPGGDLLSGTCTYAANTTFIAHDGSQVTTIPTQVPFSNGTLTVALQPNDTGVPAGTSYQMTCTAPKQTVVNTDGKTHQSQGSWGPWLLIIPTSGGAVDLGSVRVATVPTPSMFVLFPQLKPPTGTPNGTYCLSIVGGAVVGITSCNSGGGLAWNTVDSGLWASLTSGQWASITP